MNEKIEQLLKSCLNHCRSHAITTGIPNDDILSNNFIKELIKLHYKNADDDVKNNFSHQDLLNYLKESFKKVDPTVSIAESDELETWLDSSSRNSKEKRFNTYKTLLDSEGKGTIVNAMDADTYKILDSCHNPKILNREWDRRGLVYGHVQSGKTANYIGLINRAFDAGYQIVIVLTGMTEDLRRQTQERIDSGVVGHSFQKPMGISLIHPDEWNQLEKIIPATSINKDLKKRDDIANLLSVKEKSIWVIKKNKSVLENLILWLDKQRFNSDGSENEKIHNVPFLIIDDEADNASIQSLSKKDYEEWEEAIDLEDLENLNEEQEAKLEVAKENIIKAINRNIRVALSLMSHKTFVAYTATPYSIINQPDKHLKREVIINSKKFKIDVDDLFPEHFIIPINPGNKYMGIERVFTTLKSRRLPVLTNLSSKYPNENLDENYFPTKRGETYSFIDIPTSLEDAILHFLVSIVIRKYRNHKDYNSMLIHTSHLTDNADYLSYKVNKFISKLIQYLPGDNGGYFDRMIEIFDQIQETSKNPLFDEYFDQRKNYVFPKNLSKNKILNVLEKITVVSYHSSNRKDLKHHNHKLSFKGENYSDYIVIGGNRLSRGLTLEGLICSYFVRNSTRQDSLYQMGRWFGYRIGFEDLVKIYMPKDQIYWFEIIYNLEMDLRKDFEDNNKDDIPMLPRDYAIKLASRTDMNFITDKKVPFICDPDKLRNTRKLLMTPSQNIKTSRIIKDDQTQKNNLNLVKILMDKVKEDKKSSLFISRNPSFVEIHEKNNNINYCNVDYKLIIDFLKKYNADDSIQSDIDTLIDYIIKNDVELNKWSLSLVNRGNNLTDLEVIGKKISSVERTSVLDEGSLVFSQILEGRGLDNIFDIIETEKEYDEYKKSNVIIKEYRNKKKKPILVIYPARSKGKLNDTVFPLFYCFIPVLENAQKVTYIVRKK